MDLASPVQYVKGVGPQRAEALSREGVATLEDLLFHLPLRYEDRRKFSPIADLRAGMKVAGEIRSANSKGGASLTMRTAALVASVLPSALLAVTTHDSM